MPRRSQADFVGISPEAGQCALSQPLSQPLNPPKSLSDGRLNPTRHRAHRLAGSPRFSWDFWCQPHTKGGRSRRSPRYDILDILDTLATLDILVLFRPYQPAKESLPQKTKPNCFSSLRTASPFAPGGFLTLPVLSIYRGLVC